MEEKQPLISIIVPVYNTQDYLPRCVDSLRQQTYEKLEILLVDDGSTDESGELCERFAREDARIRVLHKENGGSSSARNLGITEARGAYLGFVDSDDYVDREMYELLYGALERHHVMAAQIGRDEIAPDGKRLPDICVPPAEEEVIAPEAFMKELLMHRGDCSFCTKLLAREIFEDETVRHRFPEGALNEDFHLLIRILGGLGAIVSLPQQTYHVFYRVGSNSRKEGAESFSGVYADNVANADMAAEIVEREYPELTKIAFRFGIFQRLDYMLHIPIARMTRDNENYREVVAYLRKNWWRSVCNPVLTVKNKLYHTLFAAMPRKVRQIHRRLRG